MDSNQSEQAGPEPIDERSTGGHQRDIQAFIDEAWILPGMVAIHVHNDGFVAIDAPSGKIRKILIRDGEWTEGPALCRRKTKAFDPSVKAPITPLHPVAPTSWPDWPHIRLKRQRRPQHVKEVYVQSREFLRFDRRLHQATVTLLLVLVNVWSCGHSALLQPPRLV
jgi:hypothetical protein